MWRERIFTMGMVMVLILPLVLSPNHGRVSVKADAIVDEITEFKEEELVEKVSVKEADLIDVAEETAVIEYTVNETDLSEEEGLLFSFSGTAENSEATVIGYTGELPAHL
ncbi:hypothetical protein AB1A55_16270, partial [Lactiplantibacillus plantarum]|uniref:hypothetical protein n=1 Tax=Lactiplantibacillus plantarum TaxID=1590 RepID=UPI00345730EC